MADCGFLGMSERIATESLYDIPHMRITLYMRTRRPGLSPSISLELSLYPTQFSLIRIHRFPRDSSGRILGHDKL